MAVKLVCDFDGTIALEDVTDGLLERFADPAWRDIEARWLAGEFGSRECMARQLALVEAESDELDAYIDSISIDPGFAGFVAACERLGGIALHIVSDGIDYAIGRILRRHGLGHLAVTANALVPLPGKRYRLDFPHAAADCRVGSGTCKCTVGQLRGAAACGRGATLVIGDGSSDFCVAAHADFVFAKDRLLEHCREQAIPHRAFIDFTDIERELAAVVASLAAATPSTRLFAEIPD